MCICDDEMSIHIMALPGEWDGDIRMRYVHMDSMHQSGDIFSSFLPLCEPAGSLYFCVIVMKMVNLCSIYPGHSHHRNAIRSVLIFAFSLPPTHFHPAAAQLNPQSFQFHFIIICQATLFSLSRDRRIALRPPPTHSFHCVCVLHFALLMLLLSPSSFVLSRFRRCFRKNDATLCALCSTGPIAPLSLWCWRRCWFCFCCCRYRRRRCCWCCSLAIHETAHFHAGNQRRQSESGELHTQKRAAHRTDYWWTLQKIFPNSIVLCVPSLISWQRHESPSSMGASEWASMRHCRCKSAALWAIFHFPLCGRVCWRSSLSVRDDNVNFTHSLFLIFSVHH